MTDRCILIVSLWVYPGQEAAFEAFEHEAAHIMARQGGRIDSAIRMTPAESADPEIPFEVHIVSFPDKAAWEAYGSDPATLALREKRSKIISRTAVMDGREAGPC
jgi:hypothetical protein